LVGIGILFVPWSMKNTIETMESGSPVTIKRIILGKGNIFSYDFADLFSPEEYQRRFAVSDDKSIADNGTTKNEDF